MCVCRSHYYGSHYTNTLEWSDFSKVIKFGGLDKEKFEVQVPVLLSQDT